MDGRGNGAEEASPLWLPVSSGPLGVVQRLWFNWESTRWQGRLLERGARRHTKGRRSNRVWKAGTSIRIAVSKYFILFPGNFVLLSFHFEALCTYQADRNFPIAFFLLRRGKLLRQPWGRVRRAAVTFHPLKIGSIIYHRWRCIQWRGGENYLI